MKKPTDRAQKLDGKNRVIYLFIMFTPIVMIIKMSKMAHFLYFQVFASKKQSVSTIYYSAPKRSYCVLSENGIAIRFLSQRL